MRRFFLCVALWAAASPAAQVYRWVDPDGNIQYSDTPRPDAQVIRIPDAPPAAAPAPEPAAPGESPAAPATFSSYDRIAVVNPPDQTTVWDNSGNVAVEIAVSPALQAALGHRLVVILNGKPVGEPSTATSFSVSNLDRDTYTLQARILDGDGRVVGESPPSVFFMKRITVAPAVPPAPRAEGPPTPPPARP